MGYRGDEGGAADVYGYDVWVVLGATSGVFALCSYSVRVMFGYWLSVDKYIILYRKLLT